MLDKMHRLLAAIRKDVDAMLARPAPTNGLDGVRGDTGERGENGTQGERGVQGLQGLAGVQGHPGRDGKDGREGKDGKSANASDVAQLVHAQIRIPKDGKRGETGAQGLTGKEGAVGQIGPQGPAGPQGPKGASITGLKLKDNSLIVAIDGQDTNVGKLPTPVMPQVGPSDSGGGGGGLSSKVREAMMWLANYVPNQLVRKKFTVVQDDGWLMISNKENTTDRAAPQPTGPEVKLFNGTLTPEQDTAKQVIFGIVATAQQDGYIQGYEVDVVAGNFYRIFSVDAQGAVNELISFTASTTGWRTFNISTVLFLEGTEITLLALTTEPDPAPTTFSGDWSYSTPGGSGGPAIDPLPGECIHASNSQTIIKLSKTDDALADRSAELATLTVGDIIETQAIRWAVQNITDQGDFYQYDVSPAAQAPSDGVFLFTFETVTATPITTGRDVNYWDDIGAPYIRGIKSVDADWEDATPSPDAFGVNLIVQDADISEDWDFMSNAGTSGGVVQFPQTGWAQYTDTTYVDTLSSFILPADTDTQLPNDAGITIDSQKPEDIVTFYDGNVITGRSGDNLDAMIYFRAIPSVVNQWIDIWIDIGGTFTDLYRQSFAFPRGVGLERGILYALPSAYTLDTWEANGGIVKIRSNAVVDIYDINFNFDRSHKARA